jgi:hypothetical protein
MNRRIQTNKYRKRILMASLGRVTFKSKTGNRYRFSVFPLSTRLRKLGGIFLIAYRGRGAEGRSRYKILFVGNTDDFSQPFQMHEKARVLVRMGANCICVQSDPSNGSRQEKEHDLIAAFRPACND